MAVIINVFTQNQVCYIKDRSKQVLPSTYVIYFYTHTHMSVRAILGYAEANYSYTTIGAMVSISEMGNCSTEHVETRQIYTIKKAAL